MFEIALKRNLPVNFEVSLFYAYVIVLVFIIRIVFFLNNIGMMITYMQIFTSKIQTSYLAKQYLVLGQP